MNEMIVIAVWILAVVALLAIAVIWFLKAYKDDDYIKHNDYIIDDFYTLTKGTRDEDSW